MKVIIGLFYLIFIWLVNLYILHNCYYNTDTNREIKRDSLASIPEKLASVSSCASEEKL